jgi:hypothetical protein
MLLAKVGYHITLNTARFLISKDSPANNQIKSIESTHADPNAPIDLTLYYADGTPIT